MQNITIVYIVNTFDFFTMYKICFQNNTKLYLHGTKFQIDFKCRIFNRY